MDEKKIYIIGGCNGAGKTTASYNILPDLLNCREFVNADEIARGISPFQPETVAIKAGKLMIKRINELIDSLSDFSFETTLSTKSFVNTIERAKANGYFITLIFFWLDSTELAIDRVRKRVAEGGHNVSPDVILRRYRSGIKNLFSLYQNKVDYLMIYDNSNIEPELIAEKEINSNFIVINNDKFRKIKSYSNE